MERMFRKTPRPPRYLEFVNFNVEAKPFSKSKRHDIKEKNSKLMILFANEYLFIRLKKIFEPKFPVISQSFLS